MLNYALRRIAGIIPALFLIVTISFFLIRLAPGGPFDREMPVPAEVKKNIEKAYHLDEPLYMQYGRYVNNLLHGDLGPSFKYRDYSVNQLIASGLPYSACIGFVALAISLPLGVIFGIYAAFHHNKKPDMLVMGIVFIGMLLPTFVTAPLLIWAFAIKLALLPAGGISQGLLCYVLPIFCLVLPLMASDSRLMRASMIEVLESHFIRTAKAKGLSQWRILIGHGLKAGLMPVVTGLGPTIASIMTGSIVIEQIFSIPGIGRYFVLGALNRDYPLILGIVILYGSLLIFLNLLVDLLYAVLDPRVRYE